MKTDHEVLSNTLYKIANQRIPIYTRMYGPDWIHTIGKDGGASLSVL